jgi:hypothetical protein
MAESSPGRADGPAAPRRRRPRKSTETVRAELLSAAAIVFARRGYGGAATKEIADLAGTTQASPYRLTETHIANLYDHLHAKRTAVLALICASGDPDAEQPVRTVVNRLNDMFEVFQTVSVDVWEHGGPYQIEHAKLWHRLVAGMVVAATALEPLFLPEGWYKPTRNEVINVMTNMVTSGIFDRGSIAPGGGR